MIGEADHTKESLRRQAIGMLLDDPPMLQALQHVIGASFGMSYLDVCRHHRKTGEYPPKIEEGDDHLRDFLERIRLKMLRDPVLAELEQEDLLVFSLELARQAQDALQKQGAAQGPPS